MTKIIMFIILSISAASAGTSWFSVAKLTVTINGRLDQESWIKGYRYPSEEACLEKLALDTETFEDIAKQHDRHFYGDVRAEQPECVEEEVIDTRILESP